MKKGFTLVELSIVITIIGLLIGGVLKGQELLENSKMTATIAQVKSYTVSYVTFKDAYKGPPGDITASRNLRDCTAANRCQDGNNDGWIGPANRSGWYINLETTTETAQAWKHMALAGLIKGVPAGADTSNPAFELTHPSAPLGGGFHIGTFRADNACPSRTCQLQGVAVVWNNSPGNAFLDGSAVTPQMAYRIDDKMDDGISYTGEVFGFSSSWATGCGVLLPAPLGLASGGRGYEANNGARKSCDMAFRIAGL